MYRGLIFILGALVALDLSALAVRAEEGGSLVYAPDIVGVDRMFMVAFEVDAEGADVEMNTPDSVALFDQTQPPYETGVRKFYFRARRPDEKAEIRFAMPERELVVPIEI